LLVFFLFKFLTCWKPKHVVDQILFISYVFSVSNVFSEINNPLFSEIFRQIICEVVFGHFLTQEVNQKIFLTELGGFEFLYLLSLSFIMQVHKLLWVGKDLLVLNIFFRQTLGLIIDRILNVYVNLNCKARFTLETISLNFTYNSVTFEIPQIILKSLIDFYLKNIKLL